MKCESASAAVAFLILVTFVFSPVSRAAGTISPCAEMLEGHVINATSLAPIPGAKILIMPGNLSAETDGNGSFSVCLPSPGTYTVNATAEGYIPTEETISCAENQTIHIDLLLFPFGTSFDNGTLYGYVIDGVTGLGIPSANISITPGNLTAVTDARGFYSVSARGSTYYTITASAAGYYNASVFVFLEPNGTANATLYLTPKEERYGWVHGYVYDATNGTKIEGADVSIEPGGNTTCTDAFGYYNFTVVGGLNYTVQAVATGYQVGSKTVEVPVGQAVRADVLLMPVVTHASRIEGYVYDCSTGQPIQSAIIMAVPGNLSAVTNSSGYYYLELLPGVNYTVTCSAEGYLSNLTTLTLLTNEVRQVDFHLRPEYEYGRLYGRVLDIKTQEAIVGALVLVEPDGVSNYTNASGEYEFLLRMGFEYRISVSHENYTTQTLTVFFNESSRFDFSLYPKIYNQTVEITGVVRDQAGNPIEGARVVLSSTDGLLVRTNYTDPNGNFRFTGLPVILNYTLTISAEGYMEKTVLLRSENFTSEVYEVPPELTHLEKVVVESLDYMPILIACVLIVSIALAFVGIYYVTQRR
ncbi:MAG: carboxypeptidase regulatory-like domain-containing protein [Thermoplasmata archaeon]